MLRTTPAKSKRSKVNAGPGGDLINQKQGQKYFEKSQQ